jgi:predicted DNA-binding transcriptional regulator YafY
MSKPASRLITLIMLLQNRPSQKAAGLASELGVSVRTLHRYLAQLDEMGIPIYAERGPYGGFSLVRGYKMPPLVFTPAEAVAVSLGTGLVEDLWGQLYRSAARSALAKLENLLPEQQREEVSWACRALVTAGLYHPGLDAQAAISETLRHAIRESCRVKMLYQSASKPAPETRQLDPYALAFRRGWWYVVGYCHTRREVRTFRLDRIQELTVLKQSFQTPSGFDARAFMEKTTRGQPQVLARLKFTLAGAPVARLNRLYWSELAEQPDGSLLVTFPAPDLDWAASTILAYGPVVEVLDPPELRQLVHAWAQAIFNLNEKSIESLNEGTTSVVPRKSG